MSLALAAENSYTSQFAPRAGAARDAIIERPVLQQVIGGFAAFEAFRSAMHVIL
jgi:hypothetical protein